jgi:IS5 family transposase
VNGQCQRAVAHAHTADVCVVRLLPEERSLLQYSKAASAERRSNSSSDDPRGRMMCRAQQMVHLRTKQSTDQDDSS